ncbi:pectate lyase [Termitidicoccus mucosus]
MKIFHILLAVLALADAGLSAATEAGIEPIDISGFRDSSNHWRNIRNDGYFIQATSKDQPHYDKKQVREIAANILLFQRANGGWPKDYDMCAVLTRDQAEKVAATRNKTDTSFDNHGTHPQIAYLAKVYEATREDAYRKACERGIDFILSAQYKNGGIPQRYPGKNAIGVLVTLNDGVMGGVLGVYRDAARGQDGFSWLDNKRREKCRAAFDKGVACLLAMQNRNKQGVLQGWGQQYNQNTLKPALGRPFEHPCNAPGETCDVLDILMRIEKPSPEIVAAVKSAVAWLDKVKLTGIRVEKVAAEENVSNRKTSKTDTIVVQDPSATEPLWGRMYELETDRVLYSDRSGAIKYSLAEIDRERRSGSNWFVTGPHKIIERAYPAWMEKNNIK